MQQKLFSLCAAVLLALSFSAQAATPLLNKAAVEQTQQKQHDTAREAEFQQTEKQLQALKARLLAQRNELQENNEKLAQMFSANEDSIARQEEKLRLQSASLGELFAVVRKSAKDLQSELQQSVTSVDAQHYNSEIKKIISAAELPSMAQLTALWQALAEQIKAGGELSLSAVNYVDGQGKTQRVQAARLGAIGLIGEQGYLAWNSVRREASDYHKLPGNTPTLATVKAIQQGQQVNIVVDPSRGALLEQFALKPGLQERLSAGGVVGKIILALLAVGLLIALVRGGSLFIARQQIKKQLRTPQKPGNNPLGRVLAVYSEHNQRTLEALELRLLEAVIDEQGGLERGLSMLKLLAALAPMLGLLGTVTGMIETFQVITEFGNGDPKVMAGGISMALVTTVLGLIAAMPLLFAHNILSSKAENIHHILEKQGIGLVAERAENEQLAGLAA